MDLVLAQAFSSELIVAKNISIRMKQFCVSATIRPFALIIRIFVKNDFVILRESVSVTSEVIFTQGILSISDSTFKVTDDQIYVDRDISIVNTSIYFSSTTINAQGCINISNVNFTIDLSNTTLATEKLILLNSSAGCLNFGNYSISYIHQPKCFSTTSDFDSDSLYIIFTKLSSCNEPEKQTQMEEWKIGLIIIGIVLGVAIIFILIVLLVPFLRRKIFPYARKKGDKGDELYLQDLSLQIAKSPSFSTIESFKSS